MGSLPLPPHPTQKHISHGCACAGQLVNLGLSDEADENNIRKREWSFLGHTIGVNCLVALLGISKPRLYKCLGLVTDAKYGNDGHHKPEKRISIDRFMFNLWLKDGDTIPEKFLVVFVYVVFLGLHVSWRVPVITLCMFCGWHAVQAVCANAWVSEVLDAPMPSDAPEAPPA